MPLLTPVILGSVRSDRQGLKAARFIIRGRVRAGGGNLLTHRVLG